MNKLSFSPKESFFSQNSKADPSPPSSIIKNLHWKLFELLKFSLSINYFIKLYSVMLEVESQLNDKRFKMMIEEYQNNYLTNAWRVFLNILVTYVFLTSLAMIFTSNCQSSDFLLSMLLRMLLMVSMALIHLFAYHIELVKHNIILIFWTLVNCLLIYESIPLETPTTYEFWYLNMIIWFMISIIY